MHSHQTHNDKISAEEERHSNPLLQALKHGGALHKIVASAGSFDAVLCPTTAVLRAAGLDAALHFHHSVAPTHLSSSASLNSLDASTTSSSIAPTAPSSSLQQHASSSATVQQHPATWFILAHLIRFDNRGMSVDFSTLSGHRGAFSDALDSVFCAGVPGRSRVIRHLDPLPAQSQEAHRRFDPATLNIFLIDGIVVDEEVVKRCKQQMLAQQHHRQLQPVKGSTASTLTSPAPGSQPSHRIAAPAASSSVPVAHVASHADPASGGHNAQSPASTFSRLFGSVAGSWLGGPTAPPTEASSVAAKDSSSTSSAGKSSTATRKVTTAQELAIQYPEFQRLISVPASAQVSKALRAFVDRIIIQEMPSTTTTSSSLTTSSSSGPSQVDELAKEINGFTKQLVNQVRKIAHWKGYESVAREGIEKYITSKLYAKLFSATWAEKQIDATLKRKIGLLSPVVDIKRNLDGPEGVDQAADWASAVAAAKEMNEFRSPRDKMECLMNMCDLVQRCVVEATTLKKQNHPQQQAAGSDEHNSGTSSPSSGVAAFGADDILPALMFCVLTANPENFHSNLVFIDRFRDKELMEPHGEYNLTCMQSCAQFWLTCQAHHLHLTEEAFDTALGNVYAKPQQSKNNRRGSQTDSPPPPPPPADHRKTTGELTVDALFDNTQSHQAVAAVSAVLRAPSRSVDVQTDLSGPSSFDLTPLMERNASNESTTLPSTSSSDTAHVVKVQDVLRCVVAADAVSPLTTSVAEEFEALTISDLRDAWAELKQLRMMQKSILELCHESSH